MMNTPADVSLVQDVLDALGEAVRIETPDGQPLLTTAAFRDDGKGTPVAVQTCELGGFGPEPCRVIRQQTGCDDHCEMLVRARHALRQPLTAILANAQAANRFLCSSSPDIGEARAALADIERDMAICRELLDSLAKLIDCPPLRKTV